MTELPFDITDASARLRTDFTPEEIASVPKEKKTLFTAYLEAVNSNTKQEAKTVRATANVHARAKALGASEAALLRIKPKVDQHDAYLAHMRSIGRIK